MYSEKCLMFTVDVILSLLLAYYVKLPDITNYTMVNRTYRYFEGVPLLPFGYGLYVKLDDNKCCCFSMQTYKLSVYRSYTTFNYSNLAITPAQVIAGSNVTVEVSVTNTGKRASDEVKGALANHCGILFIYF